MIVDHITILVVIVDNLWILETCHLLHPIYLVMVLLHFSHPEYCPTCCHLHHNIIQLFHSMNMEWNAIHCSLNCVNSSHFFVIEVSNDLITRYMFWPVPAFFDQGCTKQSLLLELHNSLKYTEPTI